MKKEFVFWIICALPFLYLAYIWDDLPERIPIHWNMEGEIDGYGQKNTLLLLPFLLPLFIYFLLLAIPKIDPKKNIASMVGKYDQLRFVILLFMSALSIYIMYMTQQGEKKQEMDFLMVLIGLLFAFLGNFFQALKPNYFIGIRTPWTLERESIWKKVHVTGGRLWIAGGLLVVALGLFMSGKTGFILLISIIIFLCLFPVLHSYCLFQKEENQKKVS